MINKGYSIQIKYFSGYFNGTEYVFEWPFGLSDDSKYVIERTLHRTNGVLLNCEIQNVENLFGEDVYFYIFEEGAVLFKLVEMTCATCIINELEGVFIPRRYVDVAWFFINELSAFIKSNEFYEYQSDEVIYEKNLVDIYNRMNSNVVMDKVEDELPYSFAISICNPRIDGVKYVSINTSNSTKLDENVTITDNPGKIIDLKRILVNNTNFEDLRKLCIKRNIKRKWFKSGRKVNESSNWVGENSITEKVIDLNCLDGDRAVDVDKLIEKLRENL